MAKTSSQTETRQTKRSSPKKAATATEAAASFAEGDLGKIQSILFGEQSHKFETQLTEMTARFDRLINQTNSEFTARINALEAEHQQRLNALNQDLNDKASALDAAKLDSKAAGQILAAAAEKITKS